MTGRDSTEFGHSILPYNFGRPIRDSRSGFAISALDSNAPIKDAPVRLQNPFDFSQLNFADLQNRFLWKQAFVRPASVGIQPVLHIGFQSHSTSELV
jgi:hypothetical protein